MLEFPFRLLSEGVTDGFIAKFWIPDSGSSMFGEPFKYTWSGATSPFNSARS